MRCLDQIIGRTGQHRTACLAARHNQDVHVVLELWKTHDLEIFVALHNLLHEVVPMTS